METIPFLLRVKFTQGGEASASLFFVGGRAEDLDEI